MQFIQTCTFTGSEFLIQLPACYSIKELMFAVDQNSTDKFKFKQKARIQIYAVDVHENGYSKHLIHDERVSNSTWHQLS